MNKVKPPAGIIGAHWSAAPSPSPSNSSISRCPASCDTKRIIFTEQVLHYSLQARLLKHHNKKTRCYQHTHTRRSLTAALPDPCYLYSISSASWCWQLHQLFSLLLQLKNLKISFIHLTKSSQTFTLASLAFRWPFLFWPRPWASYVAQLGVKAVATVVEERPRSSSEAHRWGSPCTPAMSSSAALMLRHGPEMETSEF